MIGLLAIFSWCGVRDAIAAESQQPKAEMLWPNGAPGGGGPKLTAFRRTRTSPMERQWLFAQAAPTERLLSMKVHPLRNGSNSFGVAGFVLEYRHSGTGFYHPAPIQDLHRAIRTVRARPRKWKIKPGRIGVLGFSAGGHLCSTAATHFEKGDPNSSDPIERIGCRPDFAILIYATTNLTDQYTHQGTRRGLLGDNPEQKLIELLSNDAHVTAETPPTFLVHAWDDDVVPVENSVLFYMALRKSNVAAEMHLFRKGGHGGSLKHNDWPPLAQRWMQMQGLIPSSKAEPE